MFCQFWISYFFDEVNQNDCELNGNSQQKDWPKVEFEQLEIDCEKCCPKQKWWCDDVKPVFKPSCHSKLDCKNGEWSSPNKKHEVINICEIFDYEEGNHNNGPNNQNHWKNCSDVYVCFLLTCCFVWFKFMFFKKICERNLIYFCKLFKNFIVWHNFAFFPSWNCFVWIIDFFSKFNLR